MRLVTWLSLAAALGAGLNGGVFFAFSTFVMAGLRRLPPPQGMAAMQQINIAAPRPAFMTLLFGTALLAVAAAVAAVVSWGEPVAVPLLVGALLYLVAAIGFTVGYHVPLNDALAAADPATSSQQWLDYAARWTRMNHVRTLGSAAAAAAFAVAAVRSAA